MIFPRKLYYQFRNTAWQVVDLLFPPACAGCGQPGEHFCSECEAKSERGRGDICVLCGRRHGFGAALCERANWLDGVSAWGLHVDPLRREVLGLKYRGIWLWEMRFASFYSP